MKYRFYSAADSAQDSIWRYTAGTWGETQAEKYVKGLHAHLEETANDRNRWRQLPQELSVPTDLDTAVYFSRYEHHYIFFRELSNGILGIMSILHGRMDLPVRLNHDLEKLESELFEDE